MPSERPRRTKTTPRGRTLEDQPQRQSGKRRLRRRRKYSLTVEPAEAIERLMGSEGLEQLSQGNTMVQGQRVEGWLEPRGQVLTLCIAPWISDTSLWLAQPPVHVVIELQPTEQGCQFSLRPPSRHRLITTLVGSVIVAALGVVPVALLSPKWALLESLVLLAILARILWKERRFGVSFRRALLDVVWQAWSPLLPPGEEEGYRALAEPAEAAELEAD